MGSSSARAAHRSRAPQIVVPKNDLDCGASKEFKVRGGRYAGPARLAKFAGEAVACVATYIATSGRQLRSATDLYIMNRSFRRMQRGVDVPKSAIP